MTARARRAGSAAAALVLSVALATAAGAASTAARIETVAGTGAPGRSGDGGPARAAAVDHPRGILVLPGGGFLFAEPFNHTVRRVGADGRIATVAGTGVAGFAGDGGPASTARLDLVHGVAAMPDGGFVLADMLNNRIRRVWADGRITTVAGTGARGFAGDGGPAAAAELNLPRGIAAYPDGRLLIPDSSNNRIRLVRRDGTIATVAGAGAAGSSGDGGPATLAALDLPFAVSPLTDGGFLVAEARGNRIRRVAPDGTIATVAGTGAPGYGGDGGPATAAQLSGPHAVVALPDGGFLIADTANHRVRRVRPDGSIATVAGTGVAAYSGDGGPPAAAALNQPKALAVTLDRRGFLVGDAANNRVRYVAIDLRPPLVLRVSRTVAARASARIAIRVGVSRPARVDATARRNGRVVARGSVRARSGASRVVLDRRLPAGRYVVRVVARAADGRTSAASVALRVRR